MNLTDLRDELRTQTLDITADDSSIASGVASKITATKRRRAAGGIAGAAAAALVVGVVAVNSLGTPKAAELPAGTGPSAVSTATSASEDPMLGPDGMPLRTIADGPGDIVKDGHRFRAEVAGDRLVVGAIGSTGAATLSIPFRVTDTRVSIGTECWIPGISGAAAARYEVRASVSGTTGSAGMSCQSQEPQVKDLSGGTWRPGSAAEDGWKDLNVGSDVTLTVQLFDTGTGKPATMDGVHLAGALYNLASRVYVNAGTGSDGVSLPETMEHQGHLYTLDGKVSRVARPSDETLTRATPVGVPFLVAYGSGSSGEGVTNTGRSAVDLRGLDTYRGEVGLGGWTTAPQPARGAGSVSIEHVGAAATDGFDFIAVYVLSD